MKKIIYILLILNILILTINNSYASEKKYLPVVKISTYQNIFGKYIKELGWGSASIINDKGYIITNNHVVDNGNGNVSDYFNICLTYSYNEKPKCNFTATLISRDKKLDIAVLQINKLDIFGKKLDYKKLSYYNIDYNYNLKSKGSIYAIGYPGIGSDTITKTKGIISGEINYNGVKYIKSDTLISGGNSGGALIGDNKLIGMPTFGMGGKNTSIGYSIYLSEAKDFINANLKKEAVLQKDLSNFITNKLLLDDINKKLKISDDLLTLPFDKKYKISEYTKNKLYIIKPKRKNKYLGTIIMGLGQIPNINSKEDFFYYLEKMGFYSKYYQKLKEKEIGGVKFYSPIVIGDATLGESSKMTLNVAQIDKDKFMMIYIIKPLTKDTEINKIINNNVSKFLNKIKINKENISKINFNFNLKTPKLTIQKGPGIVLNEKDGSSELFFGNLYDSFSLNLVPLTIKNGKGKKIENIYKNETLKINNDYKSMITFNGYKGFIYCSNSNIYTNKEKGGEIIQNKCTIKIYGNILGTNNNKYIIEASLVSNKNNISNNLDKAFDFMRQKINIGSGKTRLINVYKNIIPLKFKDLGYQSDNYKKLLKKLIKYKILINSEKFNGNKAIKWNEFILYYLRSVYNYKFNRNYSCKESVYICLYKNNTFNINGKPIILYDIIKDMGIPLNEYVDKKKVKPFFLDMKLILSGAKEEKFTEKWYNQYKILSSNSIFESIVSKLDIFKNMIFGKEKVKVTKLLGVWSIPTYFSTKKVIYIPLFKKPVTIVLFNDKKFNYSSLSINSTSKYEKICKNEFTVSCYDVLTKANMIDILVPKINFTLFDKNLKNNSKTLY